jgi:hypothetical protein
MMKMETKNLKMEGVNKGEVVDFSDVTTVEQLKNKIVENYVLCCRKCFSHNICKFHDSSEPPCPLLEKIVRNYIDMNIKSVNTASQWELQDFIKSTMLLIDIFVDFISWQGIYVDEWYNWYFESMHPSLNSTIAHGLLDNISKFLSAYRVVKIGRVMRFIVLVEGNSEYVALPPILAELGVSGINYDGKNSVRFINMEGKDRLQKEKIRDNLKKFREDGVSYFLVIDNDPNVTTYIEDLKRESLIDDKHYLIWEHKFEDNFPAEIILTVLDEEVRGVAASIDVNELNKYNTTKHDIAKSIEYCLHKKGIQFSFNDYKVSVAKKLASLVCKEIEESMMIGATYDGLRTPKSKSFPQFVERLSGIAEEMKRESTEFHVVKKDETKE